MQTLLKGASSQAARLEEIYGFVSLFLLYISLLIGPLYFRFPSLLLKEQVSKARRAIGVSAWYFAVLHFSITFFGQLGGMQGLAFLSNNYLVTLALGGAGLLILTLLAITSLDKAVQLMKFNNWKLLHRLVYIAGLLILLHIIFIGSHYGGLFDMVSQITFYAVGVLLLLEAPRFDSWTKKIFSFPQIGISTAVVIILLLTYSILIFIPSTNNVSVNVHAGHIALAEDAASNQFLNSKIPGLQGDRTLRYTVTFSTPNTIQANTDTTLSFRVYNASTGAPISYFKTPYTKTMHLIIVSNDLTYFNHIHPIQSGYDFSITTQFPKDGTYRLYLDFQPLEAIEQQDAFTVTVGTPGLETVNRDNFSTKKTFGNYEVNMDTHGKLNAQSLTFGEQTLSFTIKDAKTKKPIKTLQPYLAAFGHLVMINTNTYDYLHIHPTNLTAPLPGQTGGPTVDFLPIGIYGPIKPGIYKVFAQFNPDGNLFTADFLVNVE